MSEATVTLEPELEDIFSKLNSLSLGKAAQLVKAMEARWGVSAARTRPNTSPIPTMLDVVLESGTSR